MRKVGVALWMFWMALWGGENSYRLGEGMQIAGTPIYLGGYASFNYWNNFKGTGELSLDDAALMLYGGEGAWSFMSEVEMQDVYVHRWGFAAEERHDFALHAERIYARYEPVAWFRTLIGKFSAPIGVWNLMPINVLRDTTSSPKVVEEIFPRFVTGLEMDLVSEGEAEVILLAQATQDLDRAFNPDNPYINIDIDRHAGLGLLLPSEAWRLRINGGYYSERVEAQKWWYAYVGAAYEDERFGMLAEAGYRRSTDGLRSTFGAYWQGRAEVVQKHFAVVRLETVTDYVRNSDDTFAVFGYTYRPRYPMALKAEYQRHSRAHEDVGMCSFSILF